MDIEWAKDGIEHHLLYIVQARPETIYSRQKEMDMVIHYKLVEGTHHLLVKGLRGIGQKIAQEARISKRYS